MKARRRRLGLAFGAGALFAVGLAVGGMTQPQKVVGFLDFTGAWDPSLGLVMGGALAVYLPAYFLIRRRLRRPILAPRFVVPARGRVDGRMIAGAAIFGVGWGISGFCPGPAVVSLAGLTPAAIVCVPAMVAGALLTRALGSARAPVSADVKAGS